jgi:type III secretion system FlhB-like substrate exporter
MSQTSFEQPSHDAFRVVGLKYEPSKGVPQVVLKASGQLAEEVLRARRHATRAAPVVKNAALLEQLYRVPLDGGIGPELFRAVAALLAHVLSIEEKLKGPPHA